MRDATVFGLLLVTVFVGACAREPDPKVVEAVAESPRSASPDEVTLVGCVQATGQPDLFLLSVSGYDPDRTRGEAPGSVVPRAADSPLPPGSAGRSTPALRPRPGNQPGGETTAWTLSTDTYRLLGNGGLNLSEHLGHTVEITGTVAAEPGADRLPEDAGRGKTPGKPDGQDQSIRVRSATHVSDDCVPQLKQ